jgi:hypothetical protein
VNEKLQVFPRYLFKTFHLLKCWKHDVCHVAGFKWLRTQGVSFTTIGKEAYGANTTLANFTDQMHLNLKKLNLIEYCRLFFAWKHIETFKRQSFHHVPELKTLNYCKKLELMM